MRTTIARAQTGDERAKQALVKRLEARIQSMARYYSRVTGEDYHDLLGEAWLAAFEALEVVDMAIGEPEQFLLKSARWKVLDFVKWSHRRKTDDTLLPDTAVLEQGIAPDVINRTMVREAQTHLSDTQCEVLEGLLQGRTMRELAGSMGCTSANIAYHVGCIRRSCIAIVSTE